MTDIRYRFVLAAAAAMMGMTAGAAAPQGYYAACEGKCGAELLKALASVISKHNNVGYDGLWDVYADSDVYPEDGKIWDMYSTKHWSVKSQRCGNYKEVGDCFNREHSVPQSWFNKKSPMKSDAFHVYPTDGKVNGQRSSLPYGECAGGTTLPSKDGVKALGRRGSCTSPGYKGEVFEPVDMYKGDFARTYFYMAACYNGSISTWSSPALAGNNYPVFAKWQADVLLKWHAQDPVSDKETVRNDAVQRHQNNRNPFIDHPELADHIWGERKNEPWSESASRMPSITLPVDGSTVDMGLAAVGRTRTVTLQAAGKNITEAANVSIAGSAFSVSPATLSASQLNAGTGVKVSFNPVSAGSCSAALTITCGDVASTVTLTAEAVDGLPLSDAVNVSDRSFDLHWVNVDEADSRYTVDVRRDGVSIEGYPCQVKAADESHSVTDLEPLTTYACTVSSSSMTSRTVTVTTAAPLPSVEILFDGDLHFVCDEGDLSEVAELLLDTENIIDNITVSVDAPFELSTDRSEWSQSIVMLAEEERFYMRMRGDRAGSYTSGIEVEAGGYVNDNYDVTGYVMSLEPTFVEDFEAEFDLGSAYYTAQWQGTAALWELCAIGMYSGAHSGKQAIRFSNNSGDSWIATAADKQGGIGTVTFWAKGWKPAEGVELAVETSVDNGATWQPRGQISAAGSDDYNMYTVTVNEAKPARIRFRRTSESGRIRLDDITITDYQASTLVPETDYHTWDAYSQAGVLIISNSGDVRDALVYGMDGIVRYDAPVASGDTVIDTLTPGIYVVAVDGFSRVVAVK